MISIPRSLPLVGLLSLFCSQFVMAGDWPQILGPNRNGIAVNEELPDQFPEGGPSQVWTHPAGSGVAGAVVPGDKVILYHRIDNEELVECCSLSDGETIWTSRFPTQFRPQVGTTDGPLATPVIDGDSVYVFGTSGILAALDFASGEVRWQKNLVQMYRAQDGYFGPGSCPIVVDDLVILNVGGFRTDAGIVALNKKSGEVVWKTVPEHASYSSPVLYEEDGKKFILVSARLNTYLINTNSGEVVDSIPFGRRGTTVNASNPVVVGNHFFLTASYSIGAVWGTISSQGLEVVWEDSQFLASQYTTSVAYEGMLFGVDGRQDAGEPDLCCFDPVNKKRLWEEGDLGYATLIRAGDRLLHMNTTGALRLLAANVDQYEELDRAQLTRGTTRALPALSNGFLIIKNETEFLCFRLK